MFFKGGAIDQVVAAMISVAGSTELDFPTRSIALELMVTLTESAPALARRCNGLVQGLVPLAFALMLEEVDEDDEGGSHQSKEAAWARKSYTGLFVQHNICMH